MEGLRDSGYIKYYRRPAKKLNELDKEYQPRIDELDKQSYDKWIKNGKPLDGEQNTELMSLMREYSIKRAKIIYGKE
ncbi:MAG: hypothetical protein MJ092_01125 [Lachnospiraceae bacterium]|nr:hypothetical protein [Lachnospiraceae bacterium]